MCILPRRAQICLYEPALAGDSLGFSLTLNRRISCKEPGVSFYFWLVISAGLQQ